MSQLASTLVVGVVALTGASCRGTSAPSPQEQPAAPGAAPVIPPVPAPGPASAPVPAAPDVRRDAIPCELPAELATTCGGLDIAVDSVGRVYLADGQHVRRLRYVPGPSCRLSLEPAGELALALAPRVAPGFAAGEVAWHLFGRADGAVHAIDFTNGLWRIDGPTPASVCAKLAGAKRIAFLDERRAVIDRHDERLLDLDTCTWHRGALTPSPLAIAATEGVLFGIAAGEVYRYSSPSKPGVLVDRPQDSTPLRTPSAIVPCQGAICVLDPNTPRIERYASTGALLGTVSFARDEELVSVFAAAPDGAYWLARHGPLPREPGAQTFVYTNKLRCPVELFRVAP